MSKSGSRAPLALVEILRLFVVVFFAGLGYETARSIDANGGVLGPFNGVAVGVIVGSGIGYVVGGILGRSVAGAADRTEAVLREVSADTLVAGSIGLVSAVLIGGGIAWPLFFIPQPLVAVPLFGIVVAVIGYIGFRLGVGKRDEVLGLLGARTGVAPRPQAPSALPRVVDTSVVIDGRVLDVVRAGFLHGRMLVLQPVLDELQGFADAGDDLRRAKGRRGLELLQSLKREPGIELEVLGDEHPEIAEVDAKLVRTCLDRRYALLTLDTNLAKAAALSGVSVLNLHTLSLALRPPVTVGEDVTVHLTKPGKEPGQAVGYLDDGTMVVVERARQDVGRDVMVRVTSVVQTANGRLVFSRPAHEPEAAPAKGAERAAERR